MAPALAALALACAHRGRAPQPATPAAPVPPAAAAESSAGPHVEPDLVGVVHVVKRGETAWRIARTYGLGAQELLDVNGLSDPRQLEVGMELFVPGAAAPREVPPPGAPVPGPPSAASPAAAASASASAPEADGDEEDGGGPALPGEAAGATAIAPRPPAGVERGRGAPARLSWPVQGVLYSRFGVRQGQRHDGIDIAAPEGTPIGAAAEGQVVYAGSQSGYGSIVILRHQAGLLTLYAHASALLVRHGERVAAGQPIARVGRSGRTTGPHLHFEVREGTRPRNPLFFLP